MRYSDCRINYGQLRRAVLPLTANRLLIAGFLVISLHATSSGLSAVDDDADPVAGGNELSEEGFRQLFDGRTFTGWNGDQKIFRIEEQAVVGGTLKERIPHNFFLATDKSYADFELRLEFMLKGRETNAGVQIRSERIPDHHEMIGYQADLGQSYWGCLYDESRRNKVLARPDPEKLAAVLKLEDWNTYRIRCEGRRIQLWINDLQTVDYVEQDEEISQQGQIALQIHGGPPGEAWYRNLRIRVIP